MKSEVFEILRFQPCSTHYTVAKINNCLKIFFVIKVTTMKNTDNFCCERKQSFATTKSTLLLSAKMNGTQKEWTLVNPLRMYCGIEKTPLRLKRC